MKKLISSFIAILTVLTLASCTPTESGSTETEKPNNTTSTSNDIRILAMANQEQDVNVLSDQLKKAGFNPITNLQPDYASFVTALDAGDWDFQLTGWTTVTGNPDYAVRDIFESDGLYNKSYLDDPKVNELIEKASVETADKYVSTYTDLENHIVKENAYIVPLYSNKRIQAINTDLMSTKQRQPKSRSSVWEEYEYNDKSLNETRPLILTQTSSALTSLDPIQANDGSVNQILSNINTRLVSLTDEDEIETQGTLSYNYSIAEGNKAYYFLLRDNVYFSKAENGKSVNTGVMVGGEDVLFSLERAKNAKSVPLHKTAKLHEHMENISLVTDVNELNTLSDSRTGNSVVQTLSLGIPNGILELTTDKEKVDNDKGIYQVVKIETTEPFPQVLNYLAHQSAGIVSEKQVSEINKNFNFETYNPTKDVTYGDFNEIKNGENHLWSSGPYVLTSVDDSKVTFEKNYGYMPYEDRGKRHEPRITNIEIKFISDENSALSAFRSGEVDLLSVVPTNQVAILNNEPKLQVMERSSNSVIYGTFNLNPKLSEFSSKNLRLSVLNAIDQKPFVAVKNNLVDPVYSTLSTLIETKNVHTQDLEKSKMYLEAYKTEKTGN